jgi:4-amino-4-deoxy-L-arabinose transferase-like glycosyltransferase
VLFPALGQAALERAEIYFLDCARAMVESGDWLVPRYRGDPFFDKPALTYWLMAAAFEAFGKGPGAGRLVPALAALGVILASVWLGQRLIDRRSALAGGIVLATTVGFMSFGRVAMSDMLLALWSTLAMGLTVAAYATPAPAWAVPALGAVLGLGFLTKGPIAVLLPGLGILLYAWPRRSRRPVTPLSTALATVLFLLLGFGWWLLVYLRLGWEPLAHFFLRENLQRFGGETYDSGKTPLFYLGAYLVVGAPWALVFPRAAWRGWRDSGETRFLLAWTLAMLVPLSLSRGKIDYYLLPLLPAVSLLLGRHFTRLPWGRLDRIWSRLALGLIAIGLLLLPFALVRVAEGWISPARRMGFIAIATAAGLALVVAAWRASARLVLGGLAAAAGAVAIGVVTLLVPGFLKAQPNGAIVRDVRRELEARKGVVIVLCEDPIRVQRDILFRARTAVDERCDLWAAASAGRPTLLLLRENEMLSLSKLPGLRLVSKHAYLPATTLSLDKLEAAAPETLSLVANYAWPKDPAPKLKKKLKKQRRRASSRKHG